MLYPDVLRDISRDVPLIRTRTFFDTYTKIITICGDNVKYFILILAENRNLWYIIIHMRRLLRLRDYMNLKDTDMGTVRLILTIVLIIISVVLTAIVLMQEGKSQGLGAIAGAAETYWGKNITDSQAPHARGAFFVLRLRPWVARSRTCHLERRKIETKE